MDFSNMNQSFLSGRREVLSLENQTLNIFRNLNQVQIMAYAQTAKLNG